MDHRQESRDQRLETVGKVYRPLDPYGQDISGPFQGNGLIKFMKILGPGPPILGLFQKRIDGDDALLQLARLHFKEAGLGTEFYVETPAQLHALLQFKPTPETPAVAHLDRRLDLLSDRDLSKIVDFAQRFKHHVFGLVIHDQVELTRDFHNYMKALGELANRLKKVQSSPCIYIEYASGLSLDLFLGMCKAMNNMDNMGYGIDIGHVGLSQVRTTYAISHPNQNVCDLSAGHPQLPEVIEDVQTAVRSAIRAVIHVIDVLGKTKRPVHFHLHDGHPLSTLSPFGVCDHLSFFQKIDIPFPYKGHKHLNPLFGPGGLEQIVAQAMKRLGPQRVSFTLEIHPTEQRLPIEKHAHLFTHWRDKANAEKMNHWLSVLLENHQLVKRALGAGNMGNGTGLSRRPKGIAPIAQET